MKVSSFKDCYAMAKACYPTSKNHSLRKRLRFSLRLFCGYRSVAEKIESFFSGSALRRFIMARPEFREHLYIQQVRPSFYRDSDSAHRTMFLTSHFKLLEKTHKEEIIRGIYSQSLQPVEFLERDSKLSFSIDCHPCILKEGLLQLSVTVNNVSLYRIIFWLMEYHGKPTICISALQGGKDTLDENHAFTKEFWGLRPQNMAMMVLRFYAKAAGIQQIYTFAKKDLWCKKIASQTNLDQFWEEQGAAPVAYTPFIKLDLDTPRKALADIASRKRSAYKKRYEFMDRFQSSMAAQFENFMMPAAAMNDSKLVSHVHLPSLPIKRTRRRMQRGLTEVPVSAL